MGTEILSIGFSIDVEHGWLQPVNRIESPNQDDRPPHSSLDLIVVHGISLPPGQFGGSEIDQFFCNVLPSQGHPYFGEIQGLEVSAHALVRRDGSVTQYVPFHRRAWHAGDSRYCERTRCNDFSVGIELEGLDDCPYERQQYWSLARLVVALRHAYPSLREAEVVGHADISPGRKTDPGAAFRWPLLTDMIAALESEAASPPAR